MKYLGVPVLPDGAREAPFICPGCKHPYIHWRPASWREGKPDLVPALDLQPETATVTLEGKIAPWRG